MKPESKPVEQPAPSFMDKFTNAIGNLFGGGDKQDQEQKIEKDENSCPDIPEEVEGGPAIKDTHLRKDLYHTPGGKLELNGANDSDKLSPLKDTVDPSDAKIKILNEKKGASSKPSGKKFKLTRKQWTWILVGAGVVFTAVVIGIAVGVSSSSGGSGGGNEGNSDNEGNDGGTGGGDGAVDGGDTEEEDDEGNNSEEEDGGGSGSGGSGSGGSSDCTDVDADEDELTPEIDCNYSSLEGANEDLGGTQAVGDGTCDNGKAYYRTGLTHEEKIALVDAHNYYRQRVALGNEAGQPGATNMREMMWSEEIAEKADEHADLCNWGHDSNSDRATTNFPAVGQNLAYSGGGSKDGAYDLDFLVKLWYDEVNLYSGSAPVDSFVFDSDTGHYTQVVWANSYALGCGFKVYYEGSWRRQLTCNYGPAGNYGGQTMYVQGTFDPDECDNGASSIYGLCNPPSVPE